MTVTQALLQGAKELSSLTCAAHYAELAAVLHFPEGAAAELAGDCFGRPYDMWPYDTADEMIERDPWPLLKYPPACSEVNKGSNFEQRLIRRHKAVCLVVKTPWNVCRSGLYVRSANRAQRNGEYIPRLAPL